MVGFAVALLVLSLASTQGPVPTVHVGNQPCASCRLELAKKAVLYEGGEELGGVTRGLLLQDSRGRYYLKNLFTRSLFLVFDSTGRFLRTAGRTGAGPGEFQSILGALIGAGDTLHVFDQLNRTYTVLRPDYSVARSTRIPGSVFHAIEMKQGLLVINGAIPTPSGFGFPIHVLRNGELASPLGRDNLAERPRPTATNRPIAKASDSTFWVVDGSNYSIDLVTVSGRTLRRITRAPKWWVEAPPNTVEGVLNPRVAELQVDSAGRLWTMVRIRAPKWKDLVTQTRSRTGRPLVQSKTGNPYQHWETVLEVIDPRTSRLLVSRRFDWTMAGLISHNQLFTAAHDDVGRQKITVWRITLTGTPSER